MLVPSAASGRVDDPLEPIAEDTPQGELIFGMIRLFPALHRAHGHSPAGG